MARVFRFGCGSGLFARAGEGTSSSDGSVAGMEDNSALDKGSLAASLPLARSLFSVTICAAFFDFLVPKAAVKAIREGVVGATDVAS